MRAWFEKPLSKWMLLLLIVVLSYGGYRIYKELTMPPPLIFLIPDNYFGPVFFFFGQPDGVDVQPDPLGQAVWVPENGVIKLKAPVSDAVGTSSEKHTAIYVISVSKTKERRILKTLIGAQQNDDGSWWAGYLDEQSKLHKFFTNRINNPHSTEHPFYYFSESIRNERMVSGHQGCRHKGFSSRAVEIMEGRISVDEAGAPQCGEFLIASPNEMITAPDWMLDTKPLYSSIQQAVDEANERVKKKKEYYNLRAQESHSNHAESSPLRAKAGVPCPRTGTWQSQDAKAEKRFYKEGEIMADLDSIYGLTVWQWLGHR